LRQIKKIIKNKKAILYFEDESSIDLSPVLGKTWGPIGKTVIQKVTANRGSVSAISAISSSGNLIFNIHKAGKRFGADDIVKFLETMLNHHPRRNLVVVMDQAPCHRAKKVKSFVATQKRLNVFYLPPRSPEYNPDEKVWSHLKHHELKSHAAKNTNELRQLTRQKMRSMAKDSRKVIGIFKRCEMAHLYLS
jgi:transposase